MDDSTSVGDERLNQFDKVELVSFFHASAKPLFGIMLGRHIVIVTWHIVTNMTR